MPYSASRRGVLAVGAMLALTATGGASAQSPREDLYVIVYRKGPGWRAGRPMQQQDLAAHARYMRELTERGTVLAAGPLVTAEGGMVVLKAASQAEAEALMGADPAVASRIFLGEVSAWRPAFDPGGRFRAER
jgi:uncharacterized protein